MVIIIIVMEIIIVMVILGNNSDCVAGIALPEKAGVKLLLRWSGWAHVRIIQGLYRDEIKMETTYYSI